MKQEEKSLEEPLYELQDNKISKRREGGVPQLIQNGSVLAVGSIYEQFLWLSFV
jgi:hypothetical protein